MKTQRKNENGKKISVTCKMIANFCVTGISEGRQTYILTFPKFDESKIPLIQEIK